MSTTKHKKVEERRTVVVPVRFTPGEMAWIRTHAGLVPLSRWIRDVIYKHLACMARQGRKP